MHPLRTIGLLTLTSFASLGQADPVYTELATYSCVNGFCKPGVPVTSLVESSPGTFFGSMTFGVLYTITPAGALTLRYTLPSTNAFYISTPLQASDGQFYIPASSNNAPVVFKYDDSQQMAKALPIPILVQSVAVVETPDQLLHGASIPINADGTVYTLDFDGTAQAVSTVPEQMSIQAMLVSSSGALYGLTAPFGSATRVGSSLIQFGGANSHYRVLSRFAQAAPFLTEATDGNFYGCGHNVLFRLTPAGQYSVIHTFAGGSAGSGAYGCGIQASDGNLYGTTIDGGDFGYGTVFRATLSGQVDTVYSFTGSKEGQTTSQYAPQLTQGSDGKLYGHTLSPEVNGFGAHIGGTTFSLDLGLPKPLPRIVRSSASQVAPGSSVLVGGKNLLGTTRITLGGIDVLFVQKSSEYLDITIPADAQSGKLRVTTPNGTATSSFVIHVAPG